MSKERARRRAEREAAAAVAAARRARREARRAWRRATLRRLTPRALTARRRRRAWLLGRRRPAQRALIVGVTLGLVWVIWYLVEPVSLRIALSLLLVLALPVLVTLTFDRKV